MRFDKPPSSHRCGFILDHPGLANYALSLAFSTHSMHFIIIFTEFHSFSYRNNIPVELNGGKRSKLHRRAWSPLRCIDQWHSLNHVAHLMLSTLCIWNCVKVTVQISGECIAVSIAYLHGHVTRFLLRCVILYDSKVPMIRVMPLQKSSHVTVRKWEALLYYNLSFN